MDLQHMEKLWRESGAEGYEFTVNEFETILNKAAEAKNFGLPIADIPSPGQRSKYLTRLNASDLVLARACARGRPDAWDRFFSLYRQPLKRAAISITGSSSLGHDLADAVYAELYGLTTQDEGRICPLDSYMGTGSLRGWICAILAQHHINHYRRHRRETALEDYDPPDSAAEARILTVEPSALVKAVELAITQREPEEQFLLKAYYLDEQTFQELGALLQQHETTVARKLKRITEGLRKHVLRNLRDAGLSRRQAEEMFEVDPRDLSVDMRKLLQDSRLGTFIKKVW